MHCVLPTQQQRGAPCMLEYLLSEIAYYTVSENKWPPFIGIIRVTWTRKRLILPPVSTFTFLSSAACDHITSTSSKSDRHSQWSYNVIFKIAAMAYILPAAGLVNSMHLIRSKSICSPKFAKIYLYLWLRYYSYYYYIGTVWLLICSALEKHLLTYLFICGFWKQTAAICEFYLWFATRSCKSLWNDAVYIIPPSFFDNMYPSSEMLLVSAKKI